MTAQVLQFTGLPDNERRDTAQFASALVRQGLHGFVKAIRRALPGC